MRSCTALVKGTASQVLSRTPDRLTAGVWMPCDKHASKRLESLWEQQTRLQLTSSPQMGSRHAAEGLTGMQGDWTGYTACPLPLASSECRSACIYRQHCCGRSASAASHGHLGHTEISRPPKFLPSRPYMASSASRSSMNSTKPKPRGRLQHQQAFKQCWCWCTGTRRMPQSFMSVAAAHGPHGCNA